MSCGVGRRRGSDPALLWLWCRPAVAAPIRPLAWEPPYAKEADQEIAKDKKKKPPFTEMFSTCSQETEKLLRLFRVEKKIILQNVEKGSDCPLTYF